MTARSSGSPMLRMPYRVTTRPVWEIMARALGRLRAEGEHSILVPRGGEAVNYAVATDALSHAIERAVVVSRGRHIALSDLPEAVRRPAGRRATPLRPLPSGCTLEELERLAIVQTLELTHWNKRATAHILGIHRPTLYNKMRKHHLLPRHHDEPKR